MTTAVEGSHVLDAPARLRRPWVLGPGGVAVAAVGYVSAIHVIDPFRPHSVGCPFLGITGWWCPGCGSSRAIHRLVHGDLIGSLTYHPLMVPIVALLVWWWVGWFATHRRGERPGWARSPTELSPRWVVTIAVVFVAFWILRNTEPFSLLAPPTG
ncbi:MAG TPA: DUF2752 domain-containing protein [Acidimicrobiales bacterium]|nr:DUF2752 domain-containing protein [Acidimicrobiales bacterium]